VEIHPEGQYFIEWWEGRSRKREQVAERIEVLERARRKSVEMEATRLGVPITSLTEDGQTGGITVHDAIEDYLENIKPPQREPKTYVAYKHCLGVFEATCKKRYLAEVKREDMLAFIRHMYSIGNSGRTAYNRTVIVAQMLKANGNANLLLKRDWPDFVEPMRPVYEPEELKALFAACKPTERTIYMTFLLTGFRDKELRYVTWRDVDFRNQAIRVTAKPQYEFKPKNKEEREVPVPQSLLEMLKEHRKQQKPHPSGLVFPTANHDGDKKLENKLKKIAYRAGLNCGNCVSEHGNKCADGPYCSQWFLHKFRHTFATRNLQDGICDIRTLQTWMGHKDLASTMVYLKAVRNKDVVAKLNRSSLADLAVA
jgi:integrase